MDLFLLTDVSLEYGSHFPVFFICLNIFYCVLDNVDKIVKRICYIVKDSVIFL